MKKAVLLAIALLAIGSTAFADFMVDLEFGTSNSYSSQPNIGGAGHHELDLAAGYTGPLYVWVYGRATTTDVAYDDAFITSLKGSITQTSTGVHGDMTWGTAASNNPGKNLNVYASGYPASMGVDFSAGSYPIAGTVGGDVMIPSTAIGAFAPVANGTNVEQMDLTSWLPIGHLTYTVKAGSVGSSNILFTPTLASGGVAYQLGTAADGPLTLMIGPEQGYTTTGQLQVNIVPEPSTLILLSMGLLSLLAIRRRK